MKAILIHLLKSLSILFNRLLLSKCYILIHHMTTMKKSSKNREDIFANNLVNILVHIIELYISPSYDEGEGQEHVTPYL